MRNISLNGVVQNIQRLKLVKAESKNNEIPLEWGEHLKEMNCDNLCLIIF